MINVVYIKSNNEFSIFDLERKEHINYLKDMFSTQELDLVVSGKTIKCLTRIFNLNAKVYRLVIDCIVNYGRSVGAKCTEIKENYKVYEIDEYKIRIRI